MFLQLYKQTNLLKKENSIKTIKNKIFILKKEQVKLFYFFLKKEFLFFSIFNRKMYLKGYNYRIKFLRKNKIFRLNLGFPLPLYIKVPSIIRVRKIRKKFYSFFSFDWSTLIKFCWFLRSLRTHFPYKRRGFILAQEFALRKVGKRSRR